MKITGASSTIICNDTISKKKRSEYISVPFHANTNKKLSKNTLISVLIAGCANIISKFIENTIDISESDKYIKLRDKYSKKIEPALVNTNKAKWNFYSDSTSENRQLYSKASKALGLIFKNKSIYNKFMNINQTQLSLHEKKQLNKILTMFDEAINIDNMANAINTKTVKTIQKYNNYVPIINNQETTQKNVIDILFSETNADLRRKAYEAKIKGGDLIAEDLIELVKMRNEYAKTKGYDNYFDYIIRHNYCVEPEVLDKLIQDLYSQTYTKVFALTEERNKEIKEFFGVDELKPYHYEILLNSNPEKELDNIISKQNIEDIAKKIYAGMGFDIDKLQQEGKITLDLYPRKGKYSSGLCSEIEAGKDVRVLANLANNIHSLYTLNHELGHCVYDLGISTDLTLMDRMPASSALTEAIAIMMSNIIKTENVLKNIVSNELLNNLKKSIKYDKAIFISKCLMIVDFERNLYKNTDKNPAELWAKMRGKYLNRHVEADNEWATIPHYLTHPGYYQNYLRAMLMYEQIYNHLHSVLGNITENPKTAEYMNKNIFALGASVEEYDLIKQLTGKEFGIDDFVKGL